MRAISIKQPWASLTAAGLRNEEVSNRDTNYRGPVLLHASSKRIGRDFGQDVSKDLLCRLRNAQAIGLVPTDAELPVSAIIGTAQLTDCLPIVEQVGNVCFHLHGAQILKTPIDGVKGKQGVFEVAEIDDSRLKTSCSIAPWSCYKDGIFSIAMTDKEIDNQLPQWPLVLLVCSDNLTRPALSDDTTLQPIQTIELVSPTRSVRFPVLSVELIREVMATHNIEYISFTLQ